MNKADYYKEIYPVGTRIRLIHMDDPYAPIESGMTGTVAYVDDIKAMGGTELKLTDDELYTLVNDWRASSPNIVKFWNDVQSVAVKVITDQSSIYLRQIEVFL